MKIPSKITRMPSEVVICIDSVADGNFKGRFYSLYSKEQKCFNDIIECGYYMEQLMNSIDFPQQTIRYRSFKKTNIIFDKQYTKPEKVSTHQELMEYTGQTATIVLAIMSRNNSTWQGELFCKEKKQSFVFQSELELVNYLSEI